MHSVPALLQTALAHYGARRFADALALLRMVLALDPRHPDGLRLAGLCGSLLGDHRAALKAIRRAVVVAGPRGEPFLPNLAVALTNMAVIHAQEGKVADAIAACRTALTLAPELRDGHANLAALGGMAGLPPASLATVWRHAARLVPERPDAWKGLGGALLAARRLADADAALRLAAALSPGEPDLYLLLGNCALPRLDHADVAVTCYARAARLSPSHGALSNLSLAQTYQGQAGAALNAARRSAALSPGLAEIWMNVANVLVNGGDVEGAIRLYRRTIALHPDSASERSNLLLALQYLDDLDPLELSAEHRRFDAAFGRPRTACHDRHRNAADPERRLRVGYVSNDFRQHVASCFFEPLLACHDPERVETVCYSDTGAPDGVTRRLIALAGHWRETAGLAEAELDALIRRDGIDILVDLCGHSSGNRQTVFARRPAPVQVTWLGYPDTTGLSAVDYRLVDAVTDPEGPSDALASETLVRLPHGFLCYWPPRDAPDPGPSPALSGPVTFGSFNRLPKMTPAAVRLWAAILRRVPGSRLLMKSIGLGSDAMRGRIEAAFLAEGVTPDRLDLIAWTATWREHLELYRRVDIALDTFPYNGTTTTCEAFWMGVPMVGLLGRRHAARVGASLLGRIGLGELLAATPQEYVEIAATLAQDRPRLAALRDGMRARLRASPLCDGPGFARQVEAAYRTMWRLWCDERRKADRPLPAGGRQSARSLHGVTLPERP